jgi:hypothetical protein
MGNKISNCRKWYNNFIFPNVGIKNIQISLRMMKEVSYVLQSSLLKIGTRVKP